MNIEQAVMEHLRELSSKDQQEVLTFIKTLQLKVKPEPSIPQTMQAKLAERLLPDLRRIQWLHDGHLSAVYADSLLRNMQEIFNQFPEHPLTEFLMVLHDAMAFQNRWVSYSPEQYQGAYTLLENLCNGQFLSQDNVNQAIQELNRLGFNIMPYEVTLVPDPDLDDNE
jgi:hypothetical protein